MPFKKKTIEMPQKITLFFFIVVLIFFVMMTLAFLFISIFLMMFEKQLGILSMIISYFSPFTWALPVFFGILVVSSARNLLKKQLIVIDEKGISSDSPQKLFLAWKDMKSVNMLRMVDEKGIESYSMIFIMPIEGASPDKNKGNILIEAVAEVFKYILISAFKKKELGEISQSFREFTSGNLCFDSNFFSGEKDEFIKMLQEEYSLKRGPDLKMVNYKFQK